MTKDQEATNQRVMNRHPNAHSLIEVVEDICQEKGKTVEQLCDNT